MSRNSEHRSGFSLMEMAVLTAVVAVGVALVVPGLSQARQESRAARCGANLKVIGQAYAVWAADNGGFWPPRCRDIGQPGCEIYWPFTRWVGSTPTTEKLPYAVEPDGGRPGLALVGSPRLKVGSPPGSDDPDDYLNSGNFPLNRYIVPNWSVGKEFRLTRCPADKDTLVAPPLGDDVAGVGAGNIVDCYEMWGTSYVTNVVEYMPWHGHGPWAMYVETPLRRGRKAGPNYNPEVIYKPARYMVTLDMANMYEAWDRWLDEFGLGFANRDARWHEASVDDRWNHANVLFGDLHVAFGDYEAPDTRFTLAPINCYVQAGWSLYPYKYTPLIPSVDCP